MVPAEGLIVPDWTGPVPLIVMPMHQTSSSTLMHSSLCWKAIVAGSSVIAPPASTCRCQVGDW
jgi:hypothetical protein